MVFGGLEVKTIDEIGEDGVVVFKTTVAELVLESPGIDKGDAVVAVNTGEGAYFALLYLFFDDCCCMTTDCGILESSTIKFVAEEIEASLSLSLLLCLIYLLGQSGSSVSTMA